MEIKKNFLLNKIYHLLFGEKFNKKINFNFPSRINRIDLIKKIIKEKKLKSYLEIGCDDDKVFSKINLKIKIGVDPFSGGNFRGTSDQFFLNNKKKFDCIFIDGLHTYKQVKKDIKNSLKYLNQNGFVILHDTLPSTFSSQAVPRSRNLWNGDVWKAVVEFRTYQNLDIFTVLIDQGVTIIKKKKNTNLLKLKNRNFYKLQFKDFYFNHKKYMRIIKYNDLKKYI